MSKTIALSEQLTDLVRAVPGVIDVYSAEPALAKVVNAVVGMVSDDAGRTDRVRVSADDGGTAVAILLAVDEEASAADVCRRVHDAVEGYLTELASSSDSPTAVASISVTVGRIG